MTTTAMTASPGQQFIGLPSGSNYTADNSGSIAAVQAMDVLAMIKAGASFASSGGGGQGSFTVVPVSGPTQALAFSPNGDSAYDVTLSANCTFSIALPTTTTFHRVTVIIRPAGFTATLPASSGALVWAGGSPPSVSTSAITVITFATDGTAPIVGGL